MKKSTKNKNMKNIEKILFYDLHFEKYVLYYDIVNDDYNVIGKEFVEEK